MVLAIIQQYKSKDTIIGLAKDVGRKKEQAIFTSIGDIDETLVSEVPPSNRIIIDNLEE
jgi:precorrin-3B methylase